MDWTDFQYQFNAVFVQMMRLPDRWDVLQNHVQAYYGFLPIKSTIMSRLFGEVKNHLIQGIYVPDLTMHMLNKSHCNVNDLMYDLLDW